MASISKRPNGQWRARYRDDSGKEHARHFRRKTDARRWLDEQKSGLVTGTHVSPANATMTMREWSEQWLEGQRANRPSSYKQARSHLVHINDFFGDRPLREIRSTQIKMWLGKLQEKGLADSTVYAIYRRLSQLLGDAVEDGLISRNPCGKKVSPPQGRQRLTLATTEEVWQLHDDFPSHLRVSILLGAFAGMRVGEVCGLRVTDIDFLRGQIHPAQQYQDEPLKTESSRGTIHIPASLVEALSVHVRDYSHDYVMSVGSERVAPWTIEREFRKHRPSKLMRFHDLRHYYASLLISQGSDVKLVQSALRHASAKTTLDTYSHIWPDATDKTKAVVESVFEERHRAS